MKVNGAAVNYTGNPTNLTLAGWQTWNIDLASIGIDLSSVTSLAIGIQGPGAKGTLIIDDISLYPYPRELIAPIQPSPASLVLHYAFDGNANDITGANPGLALGGPIYLPSNNGQAIMLDGLSDHVAVNNLNYSGTNYSEVSICAWTRTNIEDNQITMSFDRSEYYRLEINGEGGGPGEIGWDAMTSTGIVDYGSNARVDNDQWHNVAGVFDNGRMTVYVDDNPMPPVFGGSAFGSDLARFGYIGVGSESETFNTYPKTPANFFTGSMDDVRFLT